MSDIYNELEEIKNKHEIEKYNELRERYQEDSSCLKCYSADKIEIGDWFKRFWKILQKVVGEVKSYNRNTYAKLLEYIRLTRKDGKESYPSSKKKKRQRIGEKKRRRRKTIRYNLICEHYIFNENDELILDDKAEENLLGNRELLTYGYIIEDDELNIRFAKFEEWLDKIESVTIKNKGY
ncbi:hypothetical protein RhiirA4_491081, partial [Rhizophagus irregularis]